MGPERRNRYVRIGAVAYAPYVVTIFEGLKRHFHRESVERTTGLRKIRRALAEPCRVVAMRDIDVGYTTQSAA